MASTSDAQWAEYYRKSAGRQVRPLAIQAASLAPAPGYAVDLGSGDGTESAFLLGRGWSVCAVDQEPAALQHLESKVKDSYGLTSVVSRLEDFHPSPADLLLACLSLPFVPPDRFEALWSSIASALKPRGILAVNLLGDRDSWSPDAPASQERAAGELAVHGMTFHTREQAKALVQSLNVVEFSETEYDGGSGRGPKHWHRFDILAQKD